jgi:ferric-dicitrate binding protein FerR (iron transport regulator)
MNNMDQQRLNYLHQAYLDESLNAQEQEEWENYFQQAEQEVPIKNLMDHTWHNILPEERIVLSPSQSEAIFNEIIKEPRVTRITLWPRIAIAAAIATILFGAGLFFYSNNKQASNDTVAFKNDVAPGRQGATLTLANGAKIRLTDAKNGELARQSGVIITKSANGQLVYEIKENSAESRSVNTLTTAKGETYQVRLPDGSLVWLNAASSLSYPANFIGDKNRRVKLDGEGYFEIAKDKAHPFIVESNNQEVEVLGTHFNVNAYSNESSTNTTLLEGSVKISAGNKQQILKPGEQGINSGNGIQVSQANIDNITDWKDGDFYLDRIDFKQAMRKIARWYDVELIYDADVPATLESGGWISRTNNLSAVLRSIEKTGQVHFKIEGRKVYISK